MKKICIVALLVMLLSLLIACGKQADEPVDTGIVSRESILSASVNGAACRVDAVKNYGGQETGMLFSISIPKAAVQDETSTVLTLELGQGWSISEESNCLVQMDGSDIIVDLSVEEPAIILRADATDRTRCFHLTVE